MIIFGGQAHRGCFVKFNFSAKDSKGAMLHLPGSSNVTIPSTDRSDGLVVQSISASYSEIVAHAKCFNQGIYTFAFGNDVGIISVNFLAFLESGKEISSRGKARDAGMAAGGSFAKVLGYYASSRVSKSLKTASISMGGGNEVLTGEVVSLDTNTAGLEQNIQSFTLKMNATKLPAGAPSGKPGVRT